MTARDLRNYLDDYYELPFERVAERYRRRHVVACLEQFKFHSLIEIGSGTESIFGSLHDVVQGTIIEPIRELINEQRKNLDGKNIKFINKQLEEVMPSEVEKAEAVLLSSILHEVTDAAGFLGLARELLSKDGVIVVVVPNSWSIHRFVGIKKGIISELDDQSETQVRMQQYQKVFNPDNLKELVEKAGFEVLSSETFFPKILSHAQMASRYEQGQIGDDFLEQMDQLSEILNPVGSEILLTAKVVK